MKESGHHFPILLAEDNPVLRKLFERMLLKAGHEVMSVESGRKAQELFKERLFPIVLTDWTKDFAVLFPKR
jgi:CheY-like chemotaxis protein